MFEAFHGAGEGLGGWMFVTLEVESGGGDGAGEFMDHAAGSSAVLGEAVEL